MTEGWFVKGKKKICLFLKGLGHLFSPLKVIWALQFCFSLNLLANYVISKKKNLSWIKTSVCSAILLSLFILISMLHRKHSNPWLSPLVYLCFFELLIPCKSWHDQIQNQNTRSLSTPVQSNSSADQAFKVQSLAHARKNKVCVFLPKSKLLIPIKSWHNQIQSQNIIS